MNSHGPAALSCPVGEECITCGDVAIPLTVVETTGADALCQALDGRTEQVAVELVGAVAVGDVLLVHAGVALEQLPRDYPHRGGV